MAEKLTKKLTHQHFVKVTFSGAFPLDMLRYDTCMPVRETDSRQIIASLDPALPAVKRTVYLKKYTTGPAMRMQGEGFSFDFWDERRWKSWGIHVDLESVERSGIPSETPEESTEQGGKERKTK